MRFLRFTTLMILVGQISLFTPPPSALCNGRMSHCDMQGTNKAAYSSGMTVQAESHCSECVRKDGSKSIADASSCSCCLNQRGNSEGTPPESAYNPAPQRSECRTAGNHSVSAFEVTESYPARVGEFEPSIRSAPPILQLTSLLRI
jgi:hypothetical protein